MLKNKKLLVCIAHWYIPERLTYLKQIISRFLSYDMEVDIIINTNSKELVSLCDKNISIYVHDELPHPYFLTWMHRKCMLYLIDNYDYFLYTEDDMDIPFENFIEYLDNFKLLFPQYVPSFVRIEKLEGKNIIVDVQKKQSKQNIITYGNKKFIKLDRPYHSFWIMPKRELSDTMTDSFLGICTTDMCREYAASYPMWGLKKIPLVMLFDNQISPLCYSYHLPNTYVLKKEKEHKFGRLEVNKLID